MRGRVSLNIGKPRLAPDPMLSSAFREGADSCHSYWLTRTVSDVEIMADSETQLFVSWTNNGTEDYTGHKAYISTDGINYSLNKTVATIYDSMRLTGLSADTLYYVKIAPYKNDNIGTLSNEVTCRTFLDDFVGATIDVTKWTETDPDSAIAQNNGIVITNDHATNKLEFANRLVSVKSIASGNTYLQAYLYWFPYDQTPEALTGIYLYKDANNFACITSRAKSDNSVYDSLRLRIVTGGVSRYDIATSIMKNRFVRIFTDGTDIKFYYNDTTEWVQLGTTQTYSLGYPLLGVITTIDNTTFQGVDNAYIDNVHFAESDFNTWPIVSSGNALAAYCWFTKHMAVYNATANKTWINLQYENLGEYTQHILEKDNSDDSKTFTSVGSVNQFEDHNEGSILVRASDNRLITAFTEHALNKLVKWRISTNPLDGTAWGAASTFEADNVISYCSIWQAAGGNIYIIYRDSTIGWCYIKSTDDGATFAGKVNFFSDISSSYTAYLKWAQSPVDPNIIHFIASGGHPETDAVTNSVFAFYLDCSTDKFYKLDGTETTANIPFDAAVDMTSVMANTLPNTGWIEDVIVDASGNPRYLITYMPDAKNVAYLTKDLYYAEWNGTAITTPYKIHTALVGYMGTHGLYGTLSYPPGSCFDVNNPDVIIASKQVDGICEIHKITRIAANSFTSTQITLNSHYDQWRPFTVKSPDKNAFWLNKVSYGSYKYKMFQSLINQTI
jgi:hypothetical protein